MILEQTKLCSTCKVKKPLKEFHKQKGCFLNVKNSCRICSNLASRTWRKNNPEKGKIYQKAWGKVNIERKRFLRKRWAKANPEKVKVSKRDYYMKKYRKDIRFKLNSVMSVGMNNSLKGNKKCQTWSFFVPYTKKELVKHIEKLFTEGMTWDKFLKGEIHIDHRIPKTVFNFTEPKHIDFKRCWALSNLQPMWAKDNLIKGSKLLKHFQPRLAI